MPTQLPLMDELALNAQKDEQALDDALACTFPASDPVSIRFHPLVSPLSSSTGTGQHALQGTSDPHANRRSDGDTSSMIDAAITTLATKDLFVVVRELGTRGIELNVIARTLTKPAKRRVALSLRGVSDLDGQRTRAAA